MAVGVERGRGPRRLHERVEDPASAGIVPVPRDFEVHMRPETPDQREEYAAHIIDGWGPGDVRAPNDSHSNRAWGCRRDWEEGLQHEGDLLRADLEATDLAAAQIRHRTHGRCMLGRQSGIGTTRADAAHADGSLAQGRKRDGHPQQLSPAFAVGAVDFDHQDDDRDVTRRTIFRASTITKAVKEITRVRIQSQAVRASVPNGPDRNGA